MVYIAPFLSAATLLSGVVTALPSRRDSSINEPAVSAPDGIPVTESQAWSSATDASAPQSTGYSSDGSSSGWNSSQGGSVYGSSGWNSTSSQDGSVYGSSGWNNTSSQDGGSVYGSSGNSTWNESMSMPTEDSTAVASSYAVTASAYATWTSSAYPTYSTPVYGSGSSGWGGSSYDDCVSQCVAQYGSKPWPYTPSPTASTDSSTSGSGATHTVIVAPSQGVLRYVPFAMNASVGDTIMFMWGGNDHTVTKSSTLNPCNSTSDAPFESGTLNKDATYSFTVNDTNPIYYHCATPGHCDAGMFGVINPPSAWGAPTSLSGMMSSMKANNSAISAYGSITDKATAKSEYASKWGGSLNMTVYPDWAQPMVAENVMFTRNFLAVNTDTIKDDGSIDFSSAKDTPLMIPMDVSAALASADSNPSGATFAASSSSSGATTSQTGSAAGASATTTGNGAISVASPQLLVGFITAIATFMLAF